MTGIEINNRIWIEKDGFTFLGTGRVDLLESIGEKGSINKAAKAMGMSYKRAWQLVNAMNDMADEPLVERLTGGSGGGGTNLTVKGQQIISEFRRIDERCKALLRDELKKCCF